MACDSDLPFSRVKQQQFPLSRGLPLGKTDWQRTKDHSSLCGGLMAKDTTSCTAEREGLLSSTKQMFWEVWDTGR